ncbi:MAG TPA: choice-of-anchor tandem repeat GloVer-containing protein [Rhizomicrobium sp.]|nr:choice-of-anchor tandem repeat GloVer-containing protein [Rhizomicrobium sp.]
MSGRKPKQRLLLGALALIAGVFAFAGNGTAQADTVLYSFCNGPNCPDGESPIRDLLKAGTTTLYGTANYGGQYNGGTVFSITTGGVYTVLHTFGSVTADGMTPISSLVKIGNRLYGTTLQGGLYFHGAVFSVKTNGTGYTVLHSFCSQTNCSDGGGPYDGLIDVGGTLYGTTAGGGTTNPACPQQNGGGCGTVFEILPTGAGFQVLYTFCSAGPCADGAVAYSRLIDVAGTLYGTTMQGGAFGSGTVYSLVPCGTPPCAESVMYSFGTNTPDGQNPFASVTYKTVGTTGYLYGTTTQGGASGNGAVFAVVLCGSPPCARQWLYSFGGAPDGVSPYGDLLDWGSYLYGSTAGGGTFGQGAVFRIRANGLANETLVNSFANSPDGAGPTAGLARIGNELYGDTQVGGSGGCPCGTVFSIP